MQRTFEEAQNFLFKSSLIVANLYSVGTLRENIPISRMVDMTGL